MQDPEGLAEELQKYPCLYEKKDKGYKERERPEGKYLESRWAVDFNPFQEYFIIFSWKLILVKC